MARKKTQLSNLIFDDIDPYGPLVGGEGGAPARLPLERVLPDIAQPRRLIPDDLIEAVYEGQMGPEQALQNWLERGNARDAPPGMRHNIGELRRLANAIARHGLINPITIRAAEPGTAPAAFDYVIVTGERRYWAHWLLVLDGRNIQEGKTSHSPDEIPVRLAAEGVSVRAHQLIENLMREDISLVDKAQGLWGLRQEMSDDAYRRHELDEGKQVPWKAVEETLDISRQYRLRLIKVLDLSPEAQQLVHQHQLAEATIRPVIARLGDRPDLQLKALEQLISWQQEEAQGEGEGRQIVPSMRALVKQLLGGDTGPKKQPRHRDPRFDLGKFQGQVRAALGQMRRLDRGEMAQVALALSQSEQRQEWLAEMRLLRDQLDTLLSQVQDEPPHDF